MIYNVLSFIYSCSLLSSVPSLLMDPICNLLTALSSGEAYFIPLFLFHKTIFLCEYLFTGDSLPVFFTSNFKICMNKGIYCYC